MHTLQCTPYHLYLPDIVKAEGCHVWDAKGKQYADLESGVWCANLGHGHPAVQAALQRQLQGVAHLGYASGALVVEQAAEALLDILGMPSGRALFLSSGSEAVEVALRMAACVTSRPLMLRFSGYYLAAYGLASGQEEGWIDLTMDAMAGQLPPIPWAEVAAFVLEPGNASGTVRLPNREMVRDIAARVQAHGGLVVVDEVTCGMGRTGKWFGFQHLDIRPDIVACGKGLGNGYPVSAVGLTSSVAEGLATKEFRYAQSHQNDPLGAAVALAVIQSIRQEQLLDSVRAAEAYLAERLAVLKERHRCIREVRHLGLMFALAFSGDLPVSLDALHRALVHSGFITGINRPGQLLRLYPPLNTPYEVLDAFIETLDGLLTSPDRLEPF